MSLNELPHERDAAVEASVNYLDRMDVRPRFFATDYSRDNLVLDARRVRITDARGSAEPPALEREGFTLRPHRSQVADFRDMDEVQRVYLPEIETVLRELTGAAAVIMTRGAVLRFGERSREFGSRVNTRPARFVHVDYTPASIPGLMSPLLEAHGLRTDEFAGYAGFNIWRVISEPPQDVPLCVCDARSLADVDLVPGDAVFDAPDAPEFSFEAYLVRHNPAHRWSYFRDMTREEVLVFKAFDSRAGHAVRVPHVAFDDPSCPADVTPRASIEVRGFAFFDG
jgi:hypothetical protein